MLKRDREISLRDSEIGNKLLYEVISSDIPYENKSIIVLNDNSVFLSGDILVQCEEKLKEIGISLTRENSYICG
jgi:hypothetical protein